MNPMKLMLMNNLMTGHITNENTVMTGETTQLTTWKQNMKILIYRSDSIGPAENDQLAMLDKIVTNIDASEAKA